MSEVPEGWAIARVEEIAEVRLGRQRSPDKAFGPNMRPYLRAANVTWAGLDISDVKEMNFEPHEMHAYVLQKGDILLAEASGSPAEVGKPAVFNGEIAECCFQNTLIRIRAADGLSPFLHQRFLYDALSGAFAQSSRGLGIHHLGAETIATWEVAFPPLKEQQRIVGKIDGLASRTRRARDSLCEIPTLIEDYRNSVLAAAFRGDITANWREDNPDSESGADLLMRIRIERRQRWEEAEFAKMIANGKPPTDSGWKERYKEPKPVDIDGLPELPEGWCWASAAELFAFVTSGSRGWAKFYADAGSLFIRIGNLEHHTIELDLRDQQFVMPPQGAEGTRTRVEPGDVLISITADLGMVGLVRDGIGDAYVNQHIALARPTDPCMAEYLAYYFATPSAGKRQLVRENRGMTKAGLGLDDILGVRVALPPRAEQAEIVRKIDAAIARIKLLSETERDAQRELSNIDRSMMVKAFRGELVSQDPGDERASIFLDRIRAERAIAAANPPERPKAPVKRTAMNNLKDTLIAAILEQKFDRFSFDDLRAMVPGNYDALKASLFALLDETPPVVCQVYDKQAGAMRLERVRS